MNNYAISETINNEVDFRFGACQEKRARHALCEVPIPVQTLQMAKTPLAVTTSPCFTFQAEHIAMQDHENVDKNDFSFDHHQIIEGLELTVSEPTVAPI